MIWRGVRPATRAVIAAMRERTERAPGAHFLMLKFFWRCIWYPLLLALTALLLVTVLFLIHI